MKNQRREWMPFDEARAFVHTLNLKTSYDWLDYIEIGNCPSNIPKTPNIVYKDRGWKHMGDWLGSETFQPKNIEYLPFEEARKFVRSLNLKKGTEWTEYCKSGQKPSNIPTAPQTVYLNQGWVGIQDWLNVDRSPVKKEFLPFNQAREFVLKQRIINVNGWREWCKNGNKPENIPSNPNRIYKDKGWINFRDWLGRHYND